MLFGSAPMTVASMNEVISEIIFVVFCDDGLLVAMAAGVQSHLVDNCFS